MNNYRVSRIRVTITWKSGAKTRYNSYPQTDLLDLLALYTPELAQIRRIKIREA